MILDPGHHLLDPLGCGAGRDRGPVDHDDRQAKESCSNDLGTRALATGVLGDDMSDGMLAQQREVIFSREWSARDDGRRSEQGQRGGGRIDKAQQVMVLRTVREIGKVHSADGQEDARRGFGQGAGGGRNVRDLGPAVAVQWRPGFAFQRDQRRVGHRCRRDGIRAHLRGEGMGRVDQMRDGFRPQVCRQPPRTAEAADADRQRLGSGRFGSSGVGQDCVQTCPGKRGCKAGGIGGAAQNKDARHG